jgi:signal transduction histidine kinase
MQKISLILFIILSSFILMVFIGGIILFIIQYRKHKLEHEQEKTDLHEEHQLQIMQTQLTSQQQTMQHIGREIHDSVGQKLTLASIYSNQLHEADVKKESIKKLIDESLQELRQLSKSLTDPSFTDLSIIDLLQKETERINASGACYVSLEHSGMEAGVQPGAKNIIFRLLQEFIQNSLKHAECRNITISLNKTANEFLIMAKDDGKGFNLNNVKQGSGLYNMKRRADELNATFSIKSEPGKGTQLSITIPLSI